MTKGRPKNDPLLAIGSPPDNVELALSAIRLHLESGRYREAHAVIDSLAVKQAETLHGIAKHNLLTSVRRSPRLERKKLD